MEFHASDSRIPVISDAPNIPILIDVKFPAVINNLDKAFETFDGSRGVLKAYRDDNKRLEMRWRKNDIYCKPTYGDRQKTTNLLLRVKRRYKKKKPDSDPAADVEYQFTVKLEGFIMATYNFNAMSDYQYLPVLRQDDGTYRNLLPDLELTKMVKRDEFMALDVPLFMPPMIFSRIDSPVEYCFRPDKVMQKGIKDALEHLPAHLIGSGRRKRTIFTIFKTFDEPMPEGPPENGQKMLMSKLKNTGLLDMVQKLFQERPIWSKNGIRCHIPTKLHPRLKYVLPLVACYFCNGPWRTLWVRFGYDPRQEKEAKKYQILDFRLRQRSAAEKLEIGGKRSSFDYNLPTVKSRSMMKIPQIRASALADKGESSSASEIQESVYVFDPAVIPPYRQMFYQFVDIKDEQIQQLMHKNDGLEERCTEKEGWMGTDVLEQSREILFKHVDRLLGKHFPPIVDPGTRSGRRIVRKIRTMLDGPEDSDDSESETLVTEGEELNEMETEMMECV